MKILKVSLPLIVLAALFSVYATRSIDQMVWATADAGALPETTLIINQMKLKPSRIASAPAKHKAE